MPTATEFATPSVREKIEATIAQAEAKTRAQVLVVVATRSGRYDRAEDIVGVLLGLVLVSLSWIFLMRFVPDPRGWSSAMVLSLGLLEVLTMFLAGFVLGSWLATRFHALARPFVSRAHRDEEVRTAAHAAYWRFRMPTSQREDFPAVVLYVSLLERVVHVAADEAVNLRLDQTPASDPAEQRYIHAVAPTWCERVRDHVVNGFTSGNGAAGIVRAVEACGETLAAAYPRTPTDANHLPDAVIVLE